MSARVPISAEELLEDVHRRVRRAAAPQGASAAEAPAEPTVAPVGPIGGWLRDVLWRGLGPFPRVRTALVRFDHRRRRRSRAADGAAGLADELALQAARVRRLEDELERARAEVEDLRDLLARAERRLAALEEELRGGARGPTAP